MSVYRFLLSPRWVGLALAMLLAAAGMVALGLWQLDRYHLRSDYNARVDAAGQRKPLPLREALPGGVGAQPATGAAWTRVAVSGHYDGTREILARARTVNGQVGVEVLTPLMLDDGTGILVDRGWLPPATDGEASLPAVPAAPAGPLQVVGRLHAPETGATAPSRVGSSWTVRRVAPHALESLFPYPLFPVYMTLESQTPPADPAFVPIAPDHQNAAMNAGYVVQWWLFAGMTVTGLGYLIVREARSVREGQARREQPAGWAEQARLKGQAIPEEEAAGASGYGEPASPNRLTEAPTSTF